MKMRYIYYIKNLSNSKFYIGLTENPKRRKTRHFSDLRNNKHDNNHLQNSFNKYGEGNFEFKIIHKEFCAPDRISELEKEYIIKYNSYTDGYNMNQGGFDNNGFVSMFSKDDVFNILATAKYVNMSGTYLSEIFNTTSASISRVLNGYTRPEYKIEFEMLSDEEKFIIYKNFDKKYNILDSVQHRLSSPTRIFPDEHYFYILAYNDQHKRRSPMMASVLKCCPSTIRLFIRGLTNKDIHTKYKEMSDDIKLELYKKSKSLFEQNASLYGNI